MRNESITDNFRMQRRRKGLRQSWLKHSDMKLNNEAN